MATQVAVPEFDGRIITVPFSFKEIDADGLPQLRPRSGTLPPGGRDRGQPRPAAAHPAGERKIAIVLSAYPTKHSRIGNAVGLDTPVSVIRLLRALRDRGYDLGEPGEIPGTGPLPAVEGEDPDTTAGNALIHALIDAGGQDPEWLTAEQLAGPAGPDPGGDVPSLAGRAARRPGGRRSPQAWGDGTRRAVRRPLRDPPTARSWPPRCGPATW